MKRPFSLALLTLCLGITSCSNLKQRLQGLDITGCQDIQWGMTLSQVKTLLGHKGQIHTDTKSGISVMEIRRTIGGIELNGFVSTESGSSTVNGVHLVYTDQKFLKRAFNVLRRTLIETYGTPAKDLAFPSGPLCFWNFASGNVSLFAIAAQSDRKGGVALSYTKTPFVPPFLSQAQPGR